MSGRCTVEVVVDGAAEVEIRGDNGTLRNLKGQMPQWRRFECTAPMPFNISNFNFRGIDGRGRQQLIQDPRSNRGAAVIQIEDPPNGSEGYTFEIRWDGGGGGYQGGDRGDRPVGRDGDRGRDRRFTVDQAIAVCQDEVRRQAAERYRARDIEFARTAIDDQPGRNDWVLGTFQVRRDRDRREFYKFSCSVNFDTGRVRSASVDPADRDRDRDRR